jgi:serine O-acetyltransferase
VNARECRHAFVDVFPERKMSGIDGAVGHGGWDLSEVVNQLRELRERQPAAGRSALKPMPLPSQPVLCAVIDDLAAALFPQRLALPAIRQPGQPLPAESTDYFVGHTLDTCLHSLRDQIRIELAARDHSHSEPLESEAHRMTRAFATQLPSIRHLLDSDLQAAYRGDPAALSLDEVLVCYPGVKAITFHRFAHALHGLGAPLVARIIAESAHSATGVDIHPGAEIGESFFIDHGTGVVIGGTAIIGKRVRLYQSVTLGAKSFPEDEQGVLVKGKPRHPIVEDDVVIYAGATILGRVTIGRGAQIGGNVWLTSSVPAETTVTQSKVISETFGEGGGI